MRQIRLLLDRILSNHRRTMSTRPSEAKPGALHLRSIQYLRAAAALMVAYFHAIDQIPGYRPWFDRYLLGHLNLASGVDIFFVISGFIMLISNRNSTPVSFATRRLIRIVPLYWLLTVALALLAVWQPAQFRTTVVSGTAILRSLLFIPYLNPGHPGELFPLLVPGWSLNLEMFFYLVFAFVLLAAARRRLWIVGAIFGVLVLLGQIARPLGVAPELLFYTDVRLLEFWLGMLIAHFVLQDRLRLSHALAVGLIVAGFVVLLTGFPVNALEPGSFARTVLGNVLPSAAVIIGAIAMERNGWIAEHPWLHWLGDASYSIYLTHIFSLGAARFIWARLGLEAGGVLSAAGFAVFGMLCVLAGAWVVYNAVEKPTLNGLQRWLKARHRVPPLPPVGGCTGA
jgi:exopolysaccharide production protein ExoZ